jgi:endonuclease/exonuclease/phosphatase family metal-dependent hydrolase
MPRTHTPHKARGLAYHYDFCYGIGLPLWPRAGGTGLLVISRFPIVDAKFKRYSCNGNPATIFHGDYLAAKGIGLVRLRVADGVTVDVFATHLHACYSPNWPPSFHTGDEYFDTRISQAFESARFIMNTWESALMVLCGDFNDERDSSVVQLQFDLIPGLRDSWVSLPQNRGKEGFTYDSGENPFANVDGCTERRRIDFMFYALMEGRQCEEKQSSTGGGQWSLVSCDVAKHKSLSKTMDVSDHYGMRAEFRLVQGMDWLPKNTTKLAKEAKAFDAQYAAALASVCEMMELGKKRMTTARTKALKFSGMVFMAWLLCIGLIYSELVSHLPSVSVFQICTNSMLVAIISVLCVLVGGTFFILGHFTFKEDINSMTALLSEANIMLEAHKRYK